jgi:ubiquinone/menaquinone biosynthesis C-methylase UbiE
MNDSAGQASGKRKSAERAENGWNERADQYDEWYETFEGAVEHHVDWSLLQRYLPKNRKAKILDAAGGTGRMTLPLARMGYRVTLCDISPRMLDVAKRKLLRERVSDAVEILECDVRFLPFRDELFDLVICWDGMIEAVKELVRVTKTHGRLSLFLMNRWRAAIDKFYGDPDSALTMLEATPSDSRAVQGGEWVGAEDIRRLFEAERVRVMDVYAVCGWLDVVPIPQEILKSRDWDEELFERTARMVLKLTEEPSVRGMTRHLVVYGEKIQGRKAAGKVGVCEGRPSEGNKVRKRTE